MCDALVAPMIGAVTAGQCKSHASAICARGTRAAPRPRSRGRSPAGRARVWVEGIAEVLARRGRRSFCRPRFPATRPRAKGLHGMIATPTPNTIVNDEAFRAELRRTRDYGIAINRQEARAHLSCVGVAMLDEAGRPIVALAISGTTQAFDIRRQAHLLRSIAADAQRMARQATRVGRSPAARA
jgi:hypothetical protein